MTARSLSREILRAKSRHSCARRRYSSALSRVMGRPLINAGEKPVPRSDLGHAVSRSAASERAPLMYVSRTEISCISLQCGHLTLSVSFQRALRFCTSASMPVGTRLLVFGQTKRRGGIIHSIALSPRFCLFKMEHLELCLRHSGFG